MIQALFAGVFLLVWLPVIVKLCMRTKAAEQTLARLGTPGRVGIAACMSALTFTQLGWIGSDGTFGFLSLVNGGAMQYVVSIPMHELGHFLFMPLGEMMTVLGGSLLEVLLPSILFVWFFKRECSGLASFALYLAGYGLIHVAAYMGTARNHDGMVFLSLDQNPETHDWFRLFGWWGLLEHDTTVSAITTCIGVVVVLLAITLLFIVPQTAGDERI